MIKKTTNIPSSLLFPSPLFFSSAFFFYSLLLEEFFEKCLSGSSSLILKNMASTYDEIPRLL